MGSRTVDGKVPMGSIGSLPPMIGMGQSGRDRINDAGRSMFAMDP